MTAITIILHTPRQNDRPLNPDFTKDPTASPFIPRKSKKADWEGRCKTGEEY